DGACWSPMAETRSEEVWTGADTDYQPSHNGSSSSTEEGDKGSSCAKSSADGESTEISNDKDQQL
ncbi:hypothetical protein JOQ06_022246, partial [Pogonophryne albipinna]